MYYFQHLAKFALIVACLWLACYLAYWMFSSEPEARKEKFCPDCGRELPASAIESQECPFCKIDPRKNANAGEKPKVLRNAGPSVSVEQVSHNKGLMATLGVIGLCVVMQLTYYTIRYLKKPKAEPTFHFKCFYCARKLRFRLSQVGRVGLCPGCQNRFKFPTPKEVKAKQA